MTFRFTFAATACWISLAAFAALAAASASDAPAPRDKLSAATASFGATPAGTPAAALAADLAAKHAKRTACLKDAKSKKLVGVAKTSYISHCVQTH